MSTVMITGGTGLIGTARTSALMEKNYEVIILSRFPEKYSSQTGLRYAKWNIEDQTIDVSSLERPEYIIHLAGAGIADKRWTSKRKNILVESRTRGGRLLGKSLKKKGNKRRGMNRFSRIGMVRAVFPGEKGTETQPFL